LYFRNPQVRTVRQASGCVRFSIRDTNRMHIGVGSVFFKARLLKATSFETAFTLFTTDYQV